ncbi:MAG: ABC transporter substrate-binding protein [Kiritimatiellae bacterium]|nr:ABC transporter substrate-binding protein [Kiritimatiellia bacterium]
MLKNVVIIGVLAAVVALPFIFRCPPEGQAWREGDPVLVVVSPHNEAIRHEFGEGFSRWHQEHYGRPALVDWRNIGGTTEISRYVQSEFVTSFKAWWEAAGRPWRGDGASIILSRSFDPTRRPDAVPESDWQEQQALYEAFRGTDDPQAFTSGMDIWFGGGTYDADTAARQGIAVAPWPADRIPPGLVATADSRELVPSDVGGEVWWRPTYYGTTLSTFGMCFNRDRMAALGITDDPAAWEDLADPRWCGTLGLADPTKSGSIAKAFETIVQVQCRKAVEAAGFAPAQADAYEAAIAAAKLPPGELPPDVPRAYQDAVERGWLEGVRLVQRIGANARYFTDSANKVPLDVGTGNAAAGICIDFYGLFEAEVANGARGADGPMHYRTPAGESGVSADPVLLLRGAPHRELACRFIQYLLSIDGQRLWCYRPGTPGGPNQYALQRVPIRRDFYPSADPEFAAACESHRRYTSRDLADPAVDAYVLAAAYEYRVRWTGTHFGMLRDLVRAMCLDSGIEQRAAWRAIAAAGGPDAVPEAYAAFSTLPDAPEPLNWLTALDVLKRHDRIDLLRDWTEHFRRQYRLALRLAQEGR